LNRFAANPAVRRVRSAFGWFNRGSNPHSAHNRSIGWNREKSRTVRGSETRAQAQPEAGLVKIMQVIFPPSDGGFLPRTTDFLTTQKRKITMNYEILLAVLIIAIFAAAHGWFLARKLRYVFDVPEGWAGLVYQHGLYVRRNNAGRHIIWGIGWTVKLTDLRKTSLLVAGQEVLTADNVGLKLSLLVTCRITDPARATHETQNWAGDIYNAAQLGARAVMGGIPVETLLNQRLEIGAQLLARARPEAAKIGVEIFAIEVKDLMFPADLKRAFAEVIKAKQESQAALERARGESASLRNLANAARLLDGNPALQNLRLMQSLTAAQNAGNTLVLGMPGGFAPLKNGKPAAPEGETG
jgi:regulator of protease activity HflC (stomatin/prohibitin superfamily)